MNCCCCNCIFAKKILLRLKQCCLRLTRKPSFFQLSFSQLHFSFQVFFFYFQPFLAKTECFSCFSFASGLDSLLAFFLFSFPCFAQAFSSFFLIPSALEFSVACFFFGFILIFPNLFCFVHSLENIQILHPQFPKCCLPLSPVFYISQPFL